MHLYRQTIILFGIIAPVLLTLAILAAGHMLKSNMVESLETKQQIYRTHNMARQTSIVLEEKVASQRPHLNRWLEQLDQETASTVATHVREISEKFPGKEIQQTSFERPNSTSGFGTASAQPSTDIKMSFRGTYKTLQQAFLELETRMPHLQLKGLSVKPMKGSSALVNFQANYSAWEK